MEIEEDRAGGWSYDKHGSKMTDEVVYEAREREGVMRGADGGAKWENVECEKKRERA